MTRVLVCISNSILIDNEYNIVGFYDQFITTLKELGNNVLVFIPNVFNNNVFASNNELKFNIIEKTLIEDIKKFNPELIFSFNNANYHNILNITNCPIVLWDADLYFMWNQKGIINKNLDRYTFFSFSKKGINNLKQNIKNLKDNQIYFVQAGTNLKRENIIQDKNISFIGTNFENDIWFINFLEKYSNIESKEFIRELNNTIFANPDIRIQDLAIVLNKYSNLEAYNYFINNFIETYYNFYSGEKRIKILDSISGLGLYLYGVNWNKIADSFPSLYGCYVNDLLYTAKHNQDLYNSSKLCINILHEQSRNGIPWRVLDIMATQGCLVSEYSKGIEDLVKDKIKLPMFENRFDAYKLCKKLLEDNVYRNEIVNTSNEIINEGYSWRKRFEEISEILKINLLNENSTNEGQITILQPKTHFVLPKYSDIKNQIRLKIWKKLNNTLEKKGLI